MAPGRSRRWLLRDALTTVAAAGLLGCRPSFSSLQNRIAVGVEPFVVFVGDGEADVGDLFAVAASGGPVFPLTFTRLHETRPALAPDGIMLAFLRTRRTSDSADYRLVVMNLSTGVERTLFRASDAERVRHIGWSPDGMLYAGTSTSLYRYEPPAYAATTVAVSPSAVAEADSAFRVYVGSPPFAEVRGCRWRGAASAVCVASRGGEEALLASSAWDPMRWGSDSVAYFQDDELTIRPLGGGSARRVVFASAPPHPRLPTYFDGR